MKVEQEAESLSITVEELLNRREKEAKKLRKEKEERKKAGISEEGRRKISESMKKRWQDPVFRANYIAANSNGTRAHSEATKKLISEKIKLKWQDEEYRDKFREPPSDEVKHRISETMKARWQQPEFREKMLSQTFARTPEWRAEISRKIREKWNDPTYRNAVQSKMRGTTSSRPRQSRKSVAPSHLKLTPLQALARKIERVELKKAKAQLRKESLEAAKLAAKDRTRSQSLKDVLGDDLWLEEKVI